MYYVEGLKHLLGEIRSKRNLLHDFVKEIKQSKEFTLFNSGIPDYVKDGHLIYMPNSTDEPFENLTVREFNTLYRKQFRDLRRWSCLSIPLKPGDSLPNNYEINEVLAFELGGGHCIAYILIQLWSPSLQQPDRWFDVYVEHRYIPGPGYPQKQKIDVNAVRRLFEKDVPEYPEYKDYVVITPSVYLYNWWKKDARKARPRLNSVDNGADLGLGPYWMEGESKFTSPVIVIDETTDEEVIWKQLLFFAWGHGYFDSNGQTLAHDQLKQYYKEGVLNKLLTHFSEHTFYPYNAISNTKYLKYTAIGYWKKGKEKESEINYPYESVRGIARETGIHWRAIYRFIEKKKELAIQSSGLLKLTPQDIEQLKEMKKLKDRRREIRDTARRVAIKEDAIKKFLYRNPNPTDEEVSQWYESYRARRSKREMQAKKSVIG